MSWLTICVIWGFVCMFSMVFTHGAKRLRVIDDFADA
nr:hypothetical protein HUO10_003285 [Paraburkholderia busanensis]